MPVAGCLLIADCGLRVADCGLRAQFLSELTIRQLCYDSWSPFEASSSQPAGVAQLVEQLIRNQQVVGSSPTAGSSFFSEISVLRASGSQPFAFDGQVDGLEKSAALIESRG